MTTITTKQYLLPKEEETLINTPYVCETPDMFMKTIFHVLVYMVSKASEDDADPMDIVEYGLDVMKALFHDYHALVKAGKLEPYQFETGTKRHEEEKQNFKEMLASLNMFLMEQGVPMKETEEGRCEVDYDEVSKQIDEIEGKEENE